jgi:hypothetical protein
MAPLPHRRSDRRKRTILQCVPRVIRSPSEPTTVAWLVAKPLPVSRDTSAASPHSESRRRDCRDRLEEVDEYRLDRDPSVLARPCRGLG